MTTSRSTSIVPTARTATNVAAPRSLGWHRLAVVLVAVALVALAACSSPSPSSSSTTTTSDPGDPTTTTEPDAATVVFTTNAGNIDAYLAADPFTRQRVVAAGTGPAGTAPHGQICFDSNGSRRFVVAETRTPPVGATTPPTAGWGLYQLSGNDVGSFEVHRLTGWDSPSAPSDDAPTTYGCAFLSTGQLVTTDVGNRQSGAATGQLVEWFPPFDGTAPASCTLATGLASPLGLTAGPDDVVYLASSRAPTAGVWRYSGSFPTSAATCVAATTGEPATPGTTLPPSTTTTTTQDGGTTTTSRPATTPSTTEPAGPSEPLVASLFIPAGDGLTTPAAVSVVPSGEAIVVTSPPDGAILAYDVDASPIGSLLKPTTGTTLGPATSFPGGTPFGIAVSPEGAVVYTDTGLVRDPSGVITPGDRTGSLRVIETQDGASLTPQDIDTGLDNPDGLGLYVPSGGGSAASKA
jgi:hypothetical protein